MNRYKNIALAALTALPLMTFSMERTELIPDDASAYMRVSNITGSIEMLKETSIGKLWADEQFQNFIGNPMKGKTWQEFFFDEESEEAQIMLDQMKMVKGEVVFAVNMRNEETILFMAMSKEDYERSLEQDEILAKNDGTIIKHDSFQGVDIIEQIESPETEWESTSWQAHVDQTIILADNREWIERSIIKLNQEKIDEPEGAPAISMTLPLDKLFAQMIEEESYDEESAEQTRTILEALGILDLEKLTLNVELKKDEIVTDAMLYARRMDRGIFKLLNTAPYQMPKVDFVPSNVTAFELTNIDLNAFIQEMKTVFESLSDDGEQTVNDALMSFRQMFGMDLEMDLLDHFGSECVSYYTLENTQMVTVVAVELKNGEAFKRGLEMLMNSPLMQMQLNGVIDTVDFVDHTLYVTTEEVTPEAVAFTVMNNRFLYGSAEGVRQAVRSHSRAKGVPVNLERMELLSDTKRFVPSNAFGFSVVDTKQLIMFVSRILANDEIADLVREGWNSSEMPIPAPDFNKLPAPEHLASFFDKIYGYAEKTPQGLHLRGILRN